MWMALLGLALAGDPEPEQSGEPPPAFDQYSFVLLKKGPKWSDDDTPENQELMKGHLAHFRRLIAEGHMLLAGPFSDQDDPDVRGLCIYRVPLDRAREHARADPRVQAGHLTVQAMHLWTEAGALAFPKAPAAPAGAP